MMIRNSRGKGTIEAKQEDEGNNNNNIGTTKSTTATAASSSSRQWSAFRNPRIVRVSRTFGGKDRHSKVCTIRGLRDRRIRLSVPTAIQLYDLQDRLGLTQPSKVIDWLLDATKNDIDILPPLQMPQGFGEFHPQLFLPHDSITPSPFFDTSLHHHNQEPEGSFTGKGKLIRADTEEEEEDGQNGLQLSAQKLFPLASTNSSLPSFFNINNPPNVQLNPYNYHWDASNLSLSQFGMVPQQPENNTAGSSQFFFCQPPVTLPSFFPQYPPFGTTQLDNNETREFSHFQLLNSGFGNSQRNNSGREDHRDQNADP